MPLLHACVPRRGLAALSVSVLVATTLTGCSTGGSGAGDEGDGTLEASDITATALNVRTAVSRVHGDLSGERRHRFAREAGELIAGYFSAAYLQERSAPGYAAAFPGFTPGARRMAMQDVEVAADGGYAWADEVEPLGAVAFLSVVAPEGRPVGATARVLLRLAVSEGERDRVVAVRGRLLLTPEQDRLQIFGYDLSVGSTPRGEDR